MKKSELKLIQLKYADSVLSEKLIFKGGSPEKFRPITFMIYLIDIGSRKILVDAGCDTMPGFEMKNYDRPVDVLKRHGYQPEDITDVIITHAHHDHIAAVHYYTAATIHIQEDEYVKGKKYIPEGLTVRCFSDQCVIADQVNVVKIGGHSRGSSIVIFELNGKKQVLAGDECYLRECLEKQLPTGSSFCPEKSQAFIEEYSKPEYAVWLFHN